MGMDGGLSTEWMKGDKLAEAEHRWAIRAIAYSLPSPSLMATWKFLVSGKCPMCGDAVADLKHMLSNCAAVLNCQAYTGRHSRAVQVVQELERQKSLGRIREYGVSNFGKDNLDNFISAGGKPVSNQVNVTTLYVLVQINVNIR